MQSNKRLGRGLAALIGDDYSEEGVVEDIKSMRHLPIELLRRNPHNPRKTFGEAELEELARSIKVRDLMVGGAVRKLEGRARATVAAEVAGATTEERHRHGEELAEVGRDSSEARAERTPGSS